MLARLIPLAVATFAASTDGLVIAGLLPSIADSLAITMEQAGRLVSVFALTYAVAAPVLGAATSSWDRRTVLSVAMAVFVLGNVLAAVSTTYGGVMAARVVSALAAALIASTAMAAASAMAPPEMRGRALATVTVGMTLAAAAGVPLGTLIGGLDWRATMWAVAGLGVVAGVGIRATLPAVPLSAATLRERLRPLRDPRILSVLAVTLAILTSGYTLYTYIGVATDRATGGGTGLLTIVLVAYGLGSVVGNIVSGHLTDRFPPERVLLVGLLLLVATLALTSVATASLVATLVWATLWGVSGWLTGLPQQHRLVTAAPESAAVVLGLNASVLQLGIAIGGGLGGLVLRTSGPDGLGFASAAVAALALGATVRSIVGRRPARAA